MKANGCILCPTDFSVPKDMEVHGEQTEEDTSATGGARDCLVLRMTHIDDNLVDAELWAESCFRHANFLCEARVQTVTYYTWY